MEWNNADPCDRLSINNINLQLHVKNKKSSHVLKRCISNKNLLFVLNKCLPQIHIFIFWPFVIYLCFNDNCLEENSLILTDLWSEEFFKHLSIYTYSCCEEVWYCEQKILKHKNVTHSGNILWNENISYKK